MVKSYLRYQSGTNFGVINSASSNNILFESARTNDGPTSFGKIALCASLDSVNVWNLRQNTLIKQLRDEDNKAEVVFITGNEARSQVAVGYGDGSIRLWNMLNYELMMTFRGHSSSISYLRYSIESSSDGSNRQGEYLLSGSRNGDVVLWDTISEAGVARYKGHRDAITGLLFLSTLEPTGSRYFLSTSKDGLVKIWDTQEKYCVHTNVEHKFEINGCISYHSCQESIRIVTGSIDGHARIFNCSLDDKGFPTLIFYASIERQLHDKILQVEFSQGLLYLLNGSRCVEIFKLLNEEESKKRLLRKKKRLKEKLTKEATKETIDTGPITGVELKPGEEWKYWNTFRASMKIRAIHPSEIKNQSGSFLVSYYQNFIELQSFSIIDRSISINPLVEFDQVGHRQDVRFAHFSSRADMILSGSNEALKVWNTVTGVCIRTLNCEVSPTNAFFIADDKAILFSDKSGRLGVLDIGNDQILRESKEAHDGSITALALKPVQPFNVFMSGGGDKSVHFWELEMQATSVGLQIGELVQMRTLKMMDEITCLCYSSSGKYVAVGLLDNTIKVFFENKLQFYLSLYGHKLPVLSMDISDDEKILISGGSDKNIKIWGLDFGDCHRSIFAHQEAILQVKCVPKTHYFFSSSRDRLIHYWDGDKFEKITSMSGHFGPVASLDVSPNGSLVVSAGGSDRCIQIWKRTEEQIFISEEREKEMELDLDRSLMEDGGIKNQIDEEEGEEETTLATVKNLENIRASEKLYEVIELVYEELAIEQEYRGKVSREEPTEALHPPQRNPLLAAIAGGLQDIALHDIVLQVVERIPTPELEQCLLVLPLHAVIHFLNILQLWVIHRSNIFLASKTLTFLIKLHGPQLTHQPQTKALLETIRKQGRQLLQSQKDMIGFNLTVLNWYKKEYELTHLEEFAIEKEEMKRKLEVKSHR